MNRVVPLAVLLIFCIGLVLGTLPGRCIGQKIEHRKAIEKKVGCYDAETGEFKYSRECDYGDQKSSDNVSNE